MRSFLLPFAAISLLLAGCGVPISPEAITATAVADQEAASRNAPPSSGGGTSTDLALSLQPASANVVPTSPGSSQPLDALPTPTDTPSAAPETAAAAEAEASPTAEATAEPSATSEAEATSEASATPEDTAVAAATPTHTPMPEPTATPQPAVASGANGSFEQEFLALLNAQRTGRGLGALSFNTTLAAGAESYAGQMGMGGFFGHDGPDGSTPASRAKATGYSGAWNGEALSAGQPTPQMALNALLASAPHAAILLDPKSIEVGIGYANVPGSRYLHYWVIVTGIP